MNFSAALTRKAEKLLADLTAAGLTVVTAESCTCGCLACLLSRGECASQVLHGGFITYTKENKAAALGVPSELLKLCGAVSEKVARAMVVGALERTTADLAVAVTGVAGPDPDPDGAPVGLVHVAAARRGEEAIQRQLNYGRQEPNVILERAMDEALDLLRQAGRLRPAPQSCSP
jgi:nicotinamide-nucleotide amidase